MRVSASINPWLPWLKPVLPSVVLLEGKALELYHGSLLGQAIPSLLVNETVFGLEKAGKKAQAIHDHLIKLGFQKRARSLEGEKIAAPFYYREDLGGIRFIFRPKRASQPPTTQGLFASPDKSLGLLLENPHSVEVKYLGEGYDIRLPQVGRFILAHGLKLGLKKKTSQQGIYLAAMNLIFILDLLVGHPELQDEALDDFLEIRPPALLREFRDNLKQNGPGSILWESALRLYLNLYPKAKIVQLTSWYWEFQKEMVKVIAAEK